ncbi:hypothetical protein V6N13_074389 [Hibiscus sabdariffa]
MSQQKLLKPLPFKKKEVLVEDVDEDDRESIQVEKIDSEEVVEIKFVASKVVDATCVGPNLVRDTTRPSKAISAMDEQ